MITIGAAVLIPGGIVMFAAYWLATKCWHDYGWPLLDRKTNQTYVVCHKCAREFQYDWHKMRIGGPRARHSDNPTSS